MATESTAATGDEPPRLTAIEAALALARYGGYLDLADDAAGGAVLVYGGHEPLPAPLQQAMEDHWDVLVELARRDPGLLGGDATGVQAPVTPSQARLLRLGRDALPGDANTTAVYDLRGPVDPSRLLDAMRSAARRHDGVQVAFASRGRRLGQRTVRDLELEITVVDGHDVDVPAWTEEVAGRPFDIERGPCWRASVLVLGPSHARLALSAHHALVDESGVRTFLHDVAQEYGAGGRGTGPAVPSILDASRRRVARDGADDRAAATALAIERLESLDIEQPATAASPRAPGEPARHRLDRSVIELSGEDVSALLCAVVAEGNSAPGGRLLTIVLAAFTYVVARRRDVDVVPVLLNVDTRSDDEREVFGMLVDPVVCLLAAPRDATWREMFDRTRVQLALALEDVAQGVDFDAVTRALSRRTGAPIVTSVAATVNWIPGDGSFALPDCRVDRLDPPPFATMTSLLLEARRSGDGGVRITLTHPREARAAAEAAGTLRQTDLLLREAIAAGPAGAADLSLATVARSRFDRSAGSGDELEPTTVSFDHLRPAEPTRTALLHDGVAVTYEELARASNAIGDALRRDGVRPGERVALGLDGSPAAVTAFLGIVRTGGVAVVLPPDLPDEERDRRCALAGVRVAVDALADRVGPASDSADPPAVPDPNLGTSGVYVLFTSGSTAAPKGVCVERRNLDAFLQAMQQVHPLHADDRVLHHTPLSFDVGLAEVVWPLSVGSTVVIAGHGSSPATRRRLIMETNVSVLLGTPTVLHALTRVEAEPAPSVHRVFSIGEPLTPTLVERLRDTFPNAIVVNLYGPTETTVAVTHHVVGDVVDGPIAIGRPLPGQWLGVFDETGSTCPIGVPGELWIAGAGVARGYLDDATTRAAFVRDDSVPGGRRYRSGDRARWRDDGALELLGRLDGETKVGGLRVELADVEDVLARHPGVAEVAVNVWTAPTGRSRLHGFVIPRDTSTGSDPAALGLAIRSWARAHLQPALVPAAITIVAELPRSAAGKLDRHGLPAAPPPAAPLDGEREPTVLETTIASVLATVLGLDRCGPADDFLSLGGDSLAAVEIAELLDAEGVHVTPAQLFELPVVADLAAAVGA